jgi:hypothetical protein
MDRPVELQSRKFLSLLISKVEIERWLYTIKGYLVYVTIMVEGRDYSIDLQYVTPAEEPCIFRLPRGVFKDKPMDEASPKDVTDAFVKMLGETPFEIIPPAPLDVPWHKIPPSKHAAIRAKKIKETKSEGAPKAPDDREV